MDDGQPEADSHPTVSLPPILSSVQIGRLGWMMLRMNDAAKVGSVLIPGLRYKDAHAAIAWLERVFGFERHAVYEGPEGTVAHAELQFGTAMIMLGSATNPGPYTHLYATPQEIGGRVTSALYLVVKDCAPVWERAKAAGAEVAMELKEMEYGGKAFSVRDPEGYLWSVGEYDPWAFESGVKA
jgi:uncharacterized glyoxalase superfamily protein PhnB